MAGRFTNPFPQFMDATPEVRSGAKLFFYAAGTSTKLNTYSDRNLTVANANPIVLNSAGYPSVDIFFRISITRSSLRRLPTQTLRPPRSGRPITSTPVIPS
jgi:hypothetical protein